MSCSELPLKTSTAAKQLHLLAGLQHRKPNDAARITSSSYRWMLTAMGI